MKHVKQDKLTVSEAARILDVHPETVRRMDRRDELKGLRNYFNHRVFRLQEVLRVKAERERLVPKEPMGASDVNPNCVGTGV